jgi:heme O synthase-like polyprenyltransferase
MPSFILPVIGQEFGATASQAQWVVATTTIVCVSMSAGEALTVNLLIDRDHCK